MRANMADFDPPELQAPQKRTAYYTAKDGKHGRTIIWHGETATSTLRAPDKMADIEASVMPSETFGPGRLASVKVHMRLRRR